MSDHIATLRARLDAQTREIAELTRERDSLACAHLSRRLVGQIITLETTVASLRAALGKLVAEVSALRAFEGQVRAAVGNTNWSVLKLRFDEAEEALSAIPTCTCGVNPKLGDTEHQRGCPIFAVEVQRDRREAERGILDEALLWFNAPASAERYARLRAAVARLSALADPGATPPTLGLSENVLVRRGTDPGATS